MRAKTVNEEISFQRGKDPKDAMNIGLSKIVDKYRWANDFWNRGFGTLDYGENNYFKLISFHRIEYWRGIPILIIEVYDKDRDFIGYMAMPPIDLGIGSTYVSRKGPEAALKNMKRKISSHIANSYRTEKDYADIIKKNYDI